LARLCMICKKYDTISEFLYNNYDYILKNLLFICINRSIID
jgi:hypothetical protein